MAEFKDYNHSFIQLVKTSINSKDGRIAILVSLAPRIREGKDFIKYLKFKTSEVRPNHPK